MLQTGMGYELSQVNSLVAERNNYIAEVTEGIHKLGFDCIILPGMATPAVRNYKNKDALMQVVYTAFWNYLNFPVGSVQITKARKEEEHYESKFTDPTTSELRENMQGSCGLPVGIQVAGLPWKDEKVLGIMQYVENLLNMKGVNLPNELAL